MNRIYKIICKAFSGEAVVVSELARSSGKGCTCLETRARKSGNRLNTILFKTGTALLLAACSSGAIAQQQKYDDSSGGMLEVAGNVGSGLPVWMGITSTDQGLVYRSGGNTVVTGADLMLDYSTAPAPKFVVGGFADDGSEVKQNTVALRKGKVNGPVYGGLSHQTRMSADIDNSGNPVGQNNSADAGLVFTNQSANATQNTVDVADGVAVSGDVSGGYATIWLKTGNATAGNADATTVEAYASAYADTSFSTLTASDNTVTLGSGSSVGGNLYGGSASVLLQGGNATAGNADTTGNFTSLLADTTAAASAESTSSTLTASDNTVTLGSGSSVGGNLYGGSASVLLKVGNATAGNAHASDGSLYSYAYAYASIDAMKSTLTASDNTVALGSGSSVGGSLYGGSASVLLQGGNAIAGNADTSNTTTFADAINSVNASLSTLTASDNTVTLGSGSSVGGNLYGGSASVLTQAGGNTIAGIADATTATANAYANAYASAYAYSDRSTLMASDNTVTLGSGSSVGGNLYGGSASMLTQGGGNARGGNADATGGSANADAATNAFADASVNAYDSTLTASGNTVTLGSRSLVGGNLYGGSASVLLQGGNATGGNANATGGSTNAEASASASASANDSTLTASSNKVIVGEDSVVRGDITGGMAALTLSAGTAIAGMENGVQAIATAKVDASNTKVLANNNEVSLNGKLQGGSLYGGATTFDITPGTATGNASSSSTVTLTGSLAQATGNTVTIEEKGSISSPGGSLYGGHLTYNAGYAPESYDVFTGNTLNYLSESQSVVQRVGNFEHYNFALTPGYANTGTVLISAQDIELGANSTNVSNGSNTASIVSVSGIRSGAVLKANDQFLLMSATNSISGNGTGTSASGISQVQQGISLLYDVQTDIDQSGKKVTATILGCQTAGGDDCPVARVNPQLKALSEGYLAGSELVKRGADQIANNAIKAIDVQNNKKGYAPFAIMSGQHNRYNSGSHVTSKDFLMTGGVSYQKDKLTAGAFVEAGWGSYDTYNSFVSVTDVHGDGNDRYYGLGILGRYDFATGLYADASIRFGQNRNKFNSSDIRNSVTGENARYNLKSNYVSAHMGLGYLMKLDTKNQLDITGKYLWTRLGGKDAVIGGDNLHFDRVNSHRVRLNGEWNHHYSKTVTLKAGLGYEQEFDSKARATTYGSFDIDEASVKGGTGIVSLGLTVRPVASHQNLTLDLMANGYAGKREGASASVRMNYAF